MSEGISRRRLLGWTGAGAAVAGVGAASGYALGRSEPVAPQPGHDIVEFRGTHQAGIITPSQDELYFTALDLTSTGRATVQRMLSQWTAAAERMTRGLETAENGALPLDRETAPADTGEALELPPSSLTVTIGFGSSFFDKLGITDRRPAELATDLPAFRGDRLDPSRTGGDICIQACANDPQVAVHAVRNLIRIGFGTIAVRWAQLGYGRTSSTSIQQPTARNLFGFKDGTNNLKAEEPDLLDEHVWVQKGDGPDWMTGGSYLIARRIRMHIETWDRAPLDEQEEIMGRTKGTGAPLGGSGEFEPANYRSIDANGTPVIPLTSHIRLASADSLNGIKILRRGFNFVAGADDRGHLNAGLFFICFVRNPQTQFVPMQQALAANDAMMEYIQHTGSAVFACPPGVREGEYWGQRLLEDAV